MIILNRAEINSVLFNANLERGLLRYLKIQDLFRRIDVSKNIEFQRLFNGYYRVRRGLDWQRKFYSIFQVARRDRLTFGEILARLQKKTGRAEASFGSKLMATIDPKMPVIDKFVLQNLGLRLPSVGAIDRLEKIVEIHKQIKLQMTSFLRTSNGKYLIQQFKKHFPDARITSIKMLDLVLWQTRLKKSIKKNG